MNIPKGYIYPSKAKSVLEAVSSAANDQAKNISKMAVKNYIASFFDTTGNKRGLLSGFSTASLNYITDKSFEESGKDITKKYVQLAVFFEELRERLPFILVVDNGIKIDKGGLGVGFDSVRLIQSKTMITIPLIRTLNLNIIVGTKDQSSVDMLSTAISVLFNEMRFLGGGNRISGNYQQGDTWEVRLPHEPIEQSSDNHDLIGDDPTDSIWWTETNVPVTFEDKIQIESDSLQWMNDPPVYDQSPSNSVQVEIGFPTSIKINQQYHLSVTGHDGSILINIDNPMIANYDPQTMMITPRRLGNFIIRVMRGAYQGSEVGLLCEKAVEVTF